MLDIEKLEALALRANLPEHAAVALVPKGLEALDLEQYEIRPRRHTGQYLTSSIEDFTAYLLRASGEQGVSPEIYVATDHPYAKAILDPGGRDTPRWHDWTATLELHASDAGAALEDLCEQPVRPEAIVQFIDDWALNCRFLANGHDCTAEAARAQFADCTVETIRSLRTKTADLSREKTGLERLTVQPSLPTRLLFDCEPWRGLEPRTLPVRIQATDTGGTAALKLTVIGWADIQRKMLDEFATKLRKADAGVVFSGSFTRQAGR